VVVHINYSALFQCGNVNIKQFLEYLYEHPNEVIKCIGLALDNVRFYIQGIADQRMVVVSVSNLLKIFL
jgi:hypothetical protein